MVALIIKMNMKIMQFSSKLSNSGISLGCMLAMIHGDHFIQKRQQMPSVQT